MSRKLTFIFTLCLFAGTAIAGPELKNLDQDLRDERDALIAKLARGEDFEGSLARFVALYKQWQTRKESALGQEAQAEQQKNQAAAQRQGLDFVVGERCLLSADPKNPPHGRSSFMNADWGRVIEKKPAKLPARGPFDDPEEIILYRVAGLYKTYVISSKGPALWYEKPFDAQLGNLVLVCWVSISSEGSGSKYPPEFRDNILTQGFAAPIKEPPLIVKKADRNPLHLLGTSDFQLALRTGRWHLPDGVPVLSHVLVREDLGDSPSGHRYSMIIDDHDDFVLEVPPGVKNENLLKPFHYAWVIMGQPRFDKQLRRLVLVAYDIEQRYVTPMARSD